VALPSEDPAIEAALGVSCDLFVSLSFRVAQHSSAVRTGFQVVAVVVVSSSREDNNNNNKKRAYPLLLDNEIKLFLF